MNDRSSELQVQAPEDVLSRILSVLEVTGTVYGRFDFPAPWGIRCDPTDQARFHLLVRGVAWLTVDGDDPTYLTSGDLVLVRRGLGHAVADRPTNRDLLPASSLMRGAETQVSVFGPGGGPRATFICGAFRFPAGRSHPLISFLPPVIHIPHAQNNITESFQAITRLISMETASGRAGSELIVRRLSDVLFIHILRAWVDSLSDAASWLKALHEPRIAAALALIHKSPGQSWTVESLAREVAMSRSTFSALFTDLVGEPPMRYVARWRLQVAAQLLRRSDMSLSGVAESVGYRSSPGFARKFSREFGVGPGAYRRAQGLEEVAETTEKMLAARR